MAHPFNGLGYPKDATLRDGTQFAAQTDFPDHR